MGVSVSALLHALQPLLSSAFSVWGSPVSWLEIVAFVLAIWMVVCNMRVNPLGWPLAIASSLLYFFLFWNSKLYGDASLQIFFALVALWGWWQWLRGTDGQGHALSVRRLPAPSRWRLLLLTAAAWPLLGLFLQRHTDTDVPWWDACPTTFSIAGQWLLGRKFLENWATWLLVNLVSVALFAYKGLWLTVLLYALFAAMSVAGWRAWRQRIPA